jgi:hypothetical protein
MWLLIGIALWEEEKSNCSGETHQVIEVSLSSENMLLICSLGAV